MEKDIVYIYDVRDYNVIIGDIRNTNLMYKICITKILLDLGVPLTVDDDYCFANNISISPIRDMLYKEILEMLEAGVLPAKIDTMLHNNTLHIAIKEYRYEKDCA